MYCVDVYEFNVVVDMETGGKVPSDQLQGLIIDGKNISIMMRYRLWPLVILIRMRLLLL